MKKIKVMVFGVFDLLHPGHISFLKQAKELGDFLIVSVARDLNVIKMKNQKPIHNERQRKTNVGHVPYVDKIVLGGLTDPWPHIKRQKPDVIALGYDQGVYVEPETTGHKSPAASLRDELVKHGLGDTEVVRLKPHWPEVYKSKFLRKKL